MPFNLLLLPLLGGFVFITKWNRTRWHAIRADKERLLLYASLAGLLHLSLAFLISSIPPFIPCVSGLPCLPLAWKKHVPFEYSGISCLAFLLGAGSWPLLNLYWKQEAESDRIIRDEGGPLEQLLDSALQQEKRVMITLKGGKVYIGRIGKSFRPEQRDQSILILPVKSGYREKDKQRLVITTPYETAYENIKADNPDTYLDIIRDFGVVIPIGEITSLSIYNEEVHLKYFPHEKTDVIILP